MASKPPPAIKIPPPRKKETGSAWDKWVNAHPLIKPYAHLVAQWAPKYGVDPIYLGALLLFESLREAKRRGVDPKTIMSPTGRGYGIAQMDPQTWFGKSLFGQKISKQWAANPNNAIRFAAWYLGKGLKDYGSYDAAYARHYNPGYQGTGPFGKGNVPPDYVPRSGQLSPTDAASYGVEKTAAKQQLTDPWVLIKDGKIKYSSSANAPNASVKSFGLPLTKSQFLQAWSHYNDVYQAFAARNAKPGEVAAVLKKGWSDTALMVALSKDPGFLKSPTWKARAPQYLGLAREIMGPDKVKGGAFRDIVRNAIVRNWTESSFVEALRQRPEYLESTEFKSNEASLGNIYRSVFGEPDDQTKLTIREMTLARWKPDEAASYFRSLPEYRNSAEYRNKAYELQELLGFLPTQAEAPLIEGKPPKAPDSERIAGSPRY